MDTKTARIAALNDELRQHLIGGLAVMTTGVAALGPEAVQRIVQTIAVYDDFCHANDPHQEHDFGSFEAEPERFRYLQALSIGMTLLCAPPAFSPQTVLSPHGFADLRAC
ncbi:MAG TPA: DUF3768 domain-containing protein [Terrimicrobium sp.]